MNTTSAIPTRTTSLPAQYLSSLNQLPTAPTIPTRGATAPDPRFINQLRAQSATDINLVKMTPSLAATPLSTTSPATETPEARGATQWNAADAPAAPLRDMLKSLTAGAFHLDQRPTTFGFDPQALSSDQLQEHPETAQQAMQQFVGETFYGMLMKQMRNTVVQSDLFGNSSAKKMFESQLDQTLVQEMATNHSEFLSRPIRI